MGCATLQHGRKLPCKGGVGGIKAISFAIWEEDLFEGLITGGEITDFPAELGEDELFKYQVKNTGNTFTEEIAADEDARTLVFNGTLNVVLHKMDLKTRNEINEIAKTEVITFIELYNGKVIVQGAFNGANVTGGSVIETGGAKTDFIGSKLTITSSEGEAYLRLSPAALATYKAFSGNMEDVEN